jgi:hypothetical protein
MSAAPATLAILTSHTTPGVVYLLTRDDAGRVACSCPSMTYSGRPCKHLTGLRRLLDETIAAAEGAASQPDHARSR